MNVKNTSGGALTLSSSDLSWGKWASNPPSQITNNQTVSFYAEGAKGSATGTQGSVVYFFSDNATSFTISFDIPYSGSNSGSLTLSGTGMSNYSAQETDDSYNPANPVSFPSGGNSVTTYFAIGQAPPPPGLKLRDFRQSVQARLNGPTPGPTPATIDIATAARMISCGDIAGPELVKIFKGQSAATALDIVNSGAASPENLVNFVSRAQVLPVLVAFSAALDFAAEAILALQPKQDIHLLAEKVIGVLRKAKTGEVGDFGDLVDALEAAKGALLTTNFDDKNMRMIAAIESVLTCVYSAPGAAVAQAASCGLQCAADAGDRQKAAKWQLTYLQKALAG